MNLVQTINSQTKTCSKCRAAKPLADFYRQKVSKDGVGPWCKACMDLNRKANAKLNAEREKQTRLEWKKKNREKNRQSNRQSAARSRINNPQKFRDACRRWRQNHKHKHCANTAARRAAKNMATPIWLTKKQRGEIVQIYLRAAQLTQRDGILYHVDHIVPLRGKNVCGLHVPWNLQAIPATENCRKSNKYG